jgi:hypothetical protein
MDSCSDASTGFVVSVRSGGRKRFVVGMDGDFVLFGDDPHRAVFVDPEDVPRIVQSALELYDPEEVVVESLRPWNWSPKAQDWHAAWGREAYRPTASTPSRPGGITRPL